MPPLSHLPFAISLQALQILRLHRVATLEDFIMVDSHKLRREVEAMVDGRVKSDVLQAMDQLTNHMVQAMCMPAHASGEQLLRNLHREESGGREEVGMSEGAHGEKGIKREEEEEEQRNHSVGHLQWQPQEQQMQEWREEGGVGSGSWRLGTISTGCSSLDALLGGGLPLAAVTEVTGTAGAGKTQFCLQAAAVAAISPRLIPPTSTAGSTPAGQDNPESTPQRSLPPGSLPPGSSPSGNLPPGRPSSVAFVDTAGSFSAVRVATVIGRMLGSREKFQESRATVTRALKAVVRMKAYDIHSLLSLLSTIAEHKRKATQSADFFSVLQLLIIDSASAVVSPVLGGHGPQGHALMMNLSRMIRSLATEFGLAVLITNHSVSNEDATPKPALGESWKVTPHVRLVLDRDYDSDYCQFTLARHPCLPGGTSTLVKLGKYGILPVQSGG